MDGLGQYGTTSSANNMELPVLHHQYDAHSI